MSNAQENDNNKTNQENKENIKDLFFLILYFPPRLVMSIYRGLSQQSVSRAVFSAVCQPQFHSILPVMKAVTGILKITLRRLWQILMFIYQQRILPISEPTPINPSRKPISDEDNRFN